MENTTKSKILEEALVLFAENGYKFEQFNIVKKSDNSSMFGGSAALYTGMQAGCGASVRFPASPDTSGVRHRTSRPSAFRSSSAVRTA